MHISWGKRPKFGNRRRPTLEKQAQNAELRTKRFASERVIKIAESDPEFERILVMNTLGIDLPKRDPALDERKKLDAKLTKMLHDKIEADPEMADELLKGRMDELKAKHGGAAGLGFGDELGMEYAGTPMGQFLEQMDEFEQIQQRLGGGGSGLKNLFTDPTVITSAIGLFTSLFGKGQPAPQGNGQDIVQLPAAEYHRLMAASKQSSEPVAHESTLIETATEPPAISEKPIVAMDEQPAASLSTTQSGDKSSTEDGIFTLPGEIVESDGESTPMFFESADLDELAGYLVMPAEELVDQLKAGRIEGNPQARLIWTYLAAQDVTSFLEDVMKYTNHSVLGPHANDLLNEEHREWVVTVLDYIKQDNLDAERQAEGVEV